MRPVSVLLERFRRPAGVPAAASEELESELLPVFAALDEIETEALRLREEADREAIRRRQAAELKVEAALAEWRRRAEVERARAEAEQREVTRIEVNAIEVEASAEAVRLRERGLTRIPVFVTRLVACVTEEPL